MCQSLIFVHGILPIIENPVGSSIFHFPALQSVVETLSACGAVCCHCTFATECMGQAIQEGVQTCWTCLGQASDCSLQVVLRLT